MTAREAEVRTDAPEYDPSTSYIYNIGGDIPESTDVVVDVKSEIAPVPGPVPPPPPAVPPVPPPSAPVAGPAPPIDEDTRLKMARWKKSKKKKFFSQSSSDSIRRTIPNDLDDDYTAKFWYVDVS